jgi:hypothetical protein
MNFSISSAMTSCVLMSVAELVSLLISSASSSQPRAAQLGDEEKGAKRKRKKN